MDFSCTRLASSSFFRHLMVSRRLCRIELCSFFRASSPWMTSFVLEMISSCESFSSFSSRGYTMVDIFYAALERNLDNKRMGKQDGSQMLEQTADTHRQGRQRKNLNTSSNYHFKVNMPPWSRTVAAAPRGKKKTEAL